jgi:hypothetical protein
MQENVENTIEIAPDDSLQVVPQNDNLIDSVDLSIFDNWRTGLYEWIEGKYVPFKSRICLKDYKTFQMGGTYQYNSSDSNFKLLVRELDGNQCFLKTTTLESGASIIPGVQTKYLAISIYNPLRDYSLTFADYIKLFSNSFSISFSINK